MNETFLPDEFFEAEYKLQNHVRITLNVEDFLTEVYTGLRWVPVAEYVLALIAFVGKEPANDAKKLLKRAVKGKVYGDDGDYESWVVPVSSEELKNV